MDSENRGEDFITVNGGAIVVPAGMDGSFAIAAASRFRARLSMPPWRAN